MRVLAGGTALPHATVAKTTATVRSFPNTECVSDMLGDTLAKRATGVYGSCRASAIVTGGARRAPMAVSTVPLRQMRIGNAYVFADNPTCRRERKRSSEVSP